MSRCRGLFLCPNAAVDTLGLADRLDLAIREGAGDAKTALSVSIHGCPAGGGYECGVYEYTDLRIIGRRDRAPVPDQGLLALSPRLDALAEGCPGGALTRSEDPDRALDLDESRCVRCGMCLAMDPSFRWPAPMGSYLTLELSGRRRGAPRVYLAPKVLVPRADDPGRLVAQVAGLAALFRAGAAKNEILHDFMEREGLMGYFGGPDGG
jgi:dissimilatory sulfite reductase (desulfoviridin) alpha/beta subunit